MATRYDILEHEAVPSTQDLALEALRTTGRPALVVAARQTGGRGRSGREWWQADRGVAASLAFRPAWPAPSLGLLPLVAGVAVRRALGAVTGVKVGLKWPNDLLVGSGKAGGILSEASDGDVVVGCGVNLWWPEPPDGAIAILGHDPGGRMPVDVARSWADELLDLSAPGPDAWPRAEYLEACVTIGRRVEWDGGSGSAVDIAEDGGLVVASGGATVVVRSGEVRLER